MSISPGIIISSSSLELNDPRAMLTWYWEEITSNVFYPIIPLKLLAEWLILLQIRDISGLFPPFLDALCTIFLRHKTLLQLSIPEPKAKLKLRKQGHMDDLTDFIFFQQTVQKSRRKGFLAI